MRGRDLLAFLSSCFANGQFLIAACFNCVQARLPSPMMTGLSSPTSSKPSVIEPSNLPFFPRVFCSVCVVYDYKTSCTTLKSQMWRNHVHHLTKPYETTLWPVFPNDFLADLMVVLNLLVFFVALQPPVPLPPRARRQV